LGVPNLSTLVVSGGGIATDVTLNKNSVYAGSSVLKVLSGGTVNGLTLSSGGMATISAGGHLAGTATFSSTAVKVVFGGNAGLSLTASGFDKGGMLDFTAFHTPNAAAYSFTSNGSGGVLKITDGALHATVTLFGQYVANGFHPASDGAGGTAVTYADSSPLNLVAASHGH
jgi:autotransporter passenger strand-loop-strand repeat protein